MAAVAVRIATPAEASLHESASVWITGLGVKLQRPRTTNEKSFAGYAAVVASPGELHPVVGPRVRDAVSRGESLLVSCVGASASGKSTTLRGAEGVAVGALSALFDALASEQAERLVCVSGVVAAIALPVQGKTAIEGKQPTRERLLDALLPETVEQPAAGLKTRQCGADGLPAVAAHAVEGLTQAVARSRAEAEALVLRCCERCAAEEASGRALRCHLLISITVHRRFGDAEAEQQLAFLDLAGVSRAGGAKAGAGAAKAGAGAAKAGRPPAAGAAAAGEDPVLKAVHRVVGAPDC